MKKLFTILALAATPAMATTDCHKQGRDEYRCDTGGDTFVVSANSYADAVAKAEASATAIQGQSQDQSQSQIATGGGGGNAINGGNSVSISNPKHTTSLGVGINFDIPIGHGIQGASCRDTVRLAREMGYEIVALQILLECPHVRKLNLKVNPGDKG